MSQLLCEQVVGRGLRRASYELDEDGKFTEEVAQVFGVPFEVIPFKASKAGASAPRIKRHHVHALPNRANTRSNFLAWKGTRKRSEIRSRSIGPAFPRYNYNLTAFHPKSK